MITVKWADWVTSDAWRSADMRVIAAPPRAFEEILWLATETDIDVRRLIRLVSSDPALAIRVLRLANVAAFAAAQEITSIEQAIMRVGTKAVRNAVLAACFATWAQSTNPYGPRGVDEVQHGVGTAYLARRVATHVGASPEDSYVHGLLHDIGKLLVMKLRSEYVRLGGAKPTDEAVQAVIDTHHGDIGAAALQLWGLPEGIREPVRWHHNPLAASTHSEAAGIVYTADRLSHRYGFGCPPEKQDNLLEDPLCAAIGLDPMWLDVLDRESLQFLDATRQLVS